MKLFFTLFSILCLHICLAQTANQKVRYTQNLDAYVGVWEYATATDTFRIVLKKGISSRTFSYSECLIGGYRYVKQNSLIGNYTQGPIPSVFLVDDFDESNSAITVQGTNAAVDPNMVNPNVIRIFFKDMGLGKTTQGGKMQLLSPTQAHWTLEDDIEGIYDVTEPPIYGFSVPVDIIMTRISSIVP